MSIVKYSFSEQCELQSQDKGRLIHNPDLAAKCIAGPAVTVALAQGCDHRRSRSALGYRPTAPETRLPLPPTAARKAAETGLEAGSVNADWSGGSRTEASMRRNPHDHCMPVGRRISMMAGSRRKRCVSLGRMEPFDHD